MPLRRLTLPLELEIPGDSTGGVQDETLVGKRDVAVMLEVLALLAVPTSSVADRRHRHSGP
jgi:hypothetical protein